MSSVESLLRDKFSIHAGAVQRWRMGWLTERFPEEEIRLLMASRFSTEQAAQNIAERIRPYSDARERADRVRSALIEQHGITEGGRVIDDWLILREDWSLVEELNRYVVDGVFDTDAAAAEVAKVLKPISDAWHREIEEAFVEAEERSDEEMAEILAQREAEKLKARFLNELRSRRTRPPTASEHDESPS